MLSFRQDLASGIGCFDLNRIWPTIEQQIAQIFAHFYRRKDCTYLCSNLDQVALRQAILSVPRLNELHQQIEYLKQSGYCALLINGMGLQEFTPSIRNQLLCGLSLVLGHPTPTDPREGKLLWDVKSRPLPPGHFATFSEHSDRADLHTDTQYYAHPEEYALLYTIRAARCGGGKTLLCDGRKIKEHLSQTVVGREALNILSTYPFPFRVPTTFTRAGTVDTIETTLAPIFAHQPLIRFRRDTIEQGFQVRPDLDVPEARQALKVFFHVLENKVNVVTHYMPDDSLMICDNHTVLHGRTIYLDTKRHFLRIRARKYPTNAAPSIAGADSKPRTAVAWAR
jgi:alpha-ketoglutarate-dependent taurine dioxygenase